MKNYFNGFSQLICKKNKNLQITNLNLIYRFVEILYKIKKHPKGEEIFKDGRK